MTVKTVLFAAAVLTTLGGGTSAVRADDDGIKIAMAGPLTGKDASFGRQLRQGAEMAAADINAAGGVKGSKLTLVFGDDACDPKQAVAVANQLSTQGVKFVAGHFCSGSSIPASKVYAEEGVLMMSPGSTNPKLTEQGYGNIFRVCGRDDQQGMVAGKLLATKFKGAAIAIIHDKTAYGQGLAEETRKTLRAAGGQEKLFDAYTAGEKDYFALVSKLKQDGIEVLYVGGYYTEAGLLARQMRDQGMKTLIISGDALAAEEFWAIAGEAGEGTLLTFGPDPRAMPEAAAVVKRFVDAKQEPDGYTLYSYAAVQVYAQAVAKADSTDNEKVQKVLHSGATFDTVIGKLSFDAKGDVMAPTYVWYRWSNGKYAQVAQP